MQSVHQPSCGPRLGSVGSPQAVGSLPRRGRQVVPSWTSFNPMAKMNFDFFTILFPDFRAAATRRTCKCAGFNEDHDGHLVSAPHEDHDAQLQADREASILCPPYKVPMSRACCCSAPAKRWRARGCAALWSLTRMLISCALADRREPSIRSRVRVLFCAALSLIIVVLGSHCWQGLPSSVRAGAG